MTDIPSERQIYKLQENSLLTRTIFQKIFPFFSSANHEISLIKSQQFANLIPANYSVKGAMRKYLVFKFRLVSGVFYLTTIEFSNINTETCI